jgi:hypothetical protein
VFPFAPRSLALSIGPVPKEYFKGLFAKYLAAERAKGDQSKKRVLTEEMRCVPLCAPKEQPLFFKEVNHDGATPTWR